MMLITRCKEMIWIVQRIPHSSFNKNSPPDLMCKKYTIISISYTKIKDTPLFIKRCIFLNIFYFRLLRFVLNNLTKFETTVFVTA